MATLELETIHESPAEDVTSPSMFPIDQRGGTYSPLRPGSTLLVYQPNGTNGLKTPTRMGKSQHLAQIRSLGLLHDLQEYIASVESLAAEQKRELERVREEKRDMEKYLRSEAAANADRSAAVLDFSVSEVADLPPRMRAIVEDNRGLRELVKRYKARVQSLEHQAGAQQSQLLALAEANERLKQSLAECSRTPAEVDREETLRRQLDLKNRQLENLEHNLGVMRNKVESDAKLYRQGMAASAREKDALKRQVQATSKALEEREKELRAVNLELRKARRGQPPGGGGGVSSGAAPQPVAAAGAAEYLAAAAAAAAAAEAAAAAAAAATSSLAPPPPPPPPPPAAAVVPAVPEERIRIMLIIVREEIQVPVYVQVPAPTAATERSSGFPLLLEGPAAAAAAGSGVGDESAASGQELAATISLRLPTSLSADANGAATAAAAEGEGSPGPAMVPQLRLTSHSELSALYTASDPNGSELAQAGLDPECEVSGTCGALLPEYDTGVVAGGEGSGGEGYDDDGYGYGGGGDESGGGGATGSGSGTGTGGMHSHSSAPLPVPYSRTAARALAVRTGGVGAKHMPSHAGSAAAGVTSAGSVSHRQRHSSASGLGGSSGSVSMRVTGGGGVSTTAAAGTAGAAGAVGTAAGGEGRAVKTVGAVSRRSQMGV